MEHPARGADEGALGVGHQVARVHLHQQRQHVAAGLARAGSADDADVSVAIGLQVELCPGDGDSYVLGEGDVQRGVVPVHEPFAFVDGSPA